MTQYTLFPAFMKVDYHSDWGAHVMTLPTKAWNPVSSTGDYGSYISWNEAEIDAEVMILALVGMIAAIANAHVTFDNATIFTYPSEGARAQPRAIIPINEPGLVTFSAAALAIQNLYYGYDTEFNPVKLALLDCDTTPNFLKQRYSDISGDEKAVWDAFSDQDSAWASRAGNRPLSLRSFTTKQNDKLREEYKLS